MLSNFKPKGYDFEWRDILNPSEETLSQLALEYKLPHAAVIDCLQSEHLPKYEAFENYYFVIVRFYDKQCKPDSDNIQQLTRKIAIFYNKGFLLTIHRSETPFIESLAEKYRSNNQVSHPFDIVCKIIKNAMETFLDPIRAMDREIDLYETRIFTKKRLPDLLRTLYLLKRKIGVFKKLNVINRLALEPIHNSHRRNSFFEDMRDFELQLETLVDELNDNINSLVNLYLSLSAQKNNDVMRILTVFSAFFLPLTFIVGVYGMNFQYMPELNWHMGYSTVLLFMALVTLLIFQWFKRKHWL